MSRYEHRHPATQAIMRWFDYDHLPAGLPRDISRLHALHAEEMLAQLPDGPELTTGLRKILEGKDCLVRAAIEAADKA